MASSQDAGHGQRRSASPIECVVRTTARPFIVTLMRSQRFLCAPGSRPDDGSSSNTTEGPPTSATATASLRFMPPDRRPAALSAWSDRPTTASACSAASRASPSMSTPRSRAKRQRWSRQLRWFQRTFFWLTTCVEIKILRRVRAESSRRPPRHRRDACSMAWRCRFLTARPSQDNHVIAEK